MTEERDTPRLRAVTRPLVELPDLVSLADPASPMLWQRGDRGCVGIGETLRLSFTGPDRFSAAAARWREIAAAARIDDTVRMPGTGLVALGTFAFDDQSSAESVLIVPRLIVARHLGTAWVTEITEIVEQAGGAETGVNGADGTGIAVPAPLPVRPWAGIELAPAVPRDADHPSVTAYLAGVAGAVSRIEAGEAEKIVMARQIAGLVPEDADLRTPLRRLSDRYLDCWTFAVDGMIGASPETLVRSTDGAVSARVLAGTRGRHPEDEHRDARARDELLTSDKEQHEHAFAVQSVITALSPHVRDLRTSDEPFPLRLPNVWHLATDLGAQLGEQSSALELVGALHPTAAVAGTPTATAIAAIAELEPFDRGRYSGAVGWIDADGDGEWVIALRCAQIVPGSPSLSGAPAVAASPAPSDDTGAADERSGSPRVIIASAGGGIVHGSDPSHELRETVSKFRPIVEAFGD